MALLNYIGPDPSALTGALPLPEGWPAYEHEEADATIAAAKVASGNYEVAKPAKPNKTADGA